MTSQEIGDRLEKLYNERKNMETMSDDEVCTHYHVDTRQEAMKYLEEERQTLQPDYETQLEHEERESDHYNESIRYSYKHPHRQLLMNI